MISIGTHTNRLAFRLKLLCTSFLVSYLAGACGETNFSSNQNARTTKASKNESAEAMRAEGPAPVEAAIERVEIRPQSVEVPVGKSAEIAVYALYKDGTAVDMTASAELVIEDPALASVARAEGKPTLVYGKAVGVTNLIARFEKMEAKAAVSVSAATINLIRLSPSEPSLAVGSSVELRAFGSFSDGTTRELTADAEWLVASPEVVGLGGAGREKNVVHGLKAGSSEVKVRFQGMEGIAVVSVRDAKVLSLEIVDLKPSLVLTQTSSLKVIAVFENEDKRDVTCEASIMSSDAAAAEVVSKAAAEASEGCVFVAGKKIGKAIISARFRESEARSPIDVVDHPMVSLEIVPASVVVPLGASQKLQALANYQDNSQRDHSLEADWSVVDKTVGTIDISDKNGAVFRPLKAGKTVIKAKLGSFEGSAEITVNDAVLQSIIVSPGSVKVPAGMIQIFQAEGEYSDGSKKDITADVIWSSSDPKVAALDPSKRGQVLVLAIGSAKIFAQLSGKTTEVTLEGTSASLVSLAVTPKAPVVKLTSDQVTLQLQAMATFSDGNKRDVTADSSWMSARPELGTVSNSSATSGLAKLLKIGKVAMSATYQGKSDATEINVIEPAVPRVTILAAGRPEAVSVARRQTIPVKWSAEDAYACKVKRDGVDFDDRIKAETSVALSAQTIFSIECRNYLGEKASASVVVSVTDPQVSLKVNGSAGNLTVGLDAVVRVEWASQYAARCQLKQDAVVLSEALQGEMNLEISDASTVSLVCRDVAENLASHSIVVGVEQSVNLLVAPGARDVIPGSVSRRPIAIYFALDVTGSMGGVINTVKNNIVAFVKALRDKNLEPTLGVIPFRDGLETRFNLSSDITAFQNFVAAQVATGGGDAQEAALLAVEESLSELRVRETRPDAIKLVLAITDYPGHRGNSADCSTATTISRFNALTAAEQQNVKVFYSTAGYSYHCGGFASAKHQFDDLLSKILPAVNAADRGYALQWPFDGNTLVNTAVAMIERVLPPVDLICLNKTASVSIAGASVLEWNGDLASVYSDFEGGRQTALTKVLNNRQYDDLMAGRGAVSMSRCCVSAAAAKTGNFACVKSLPAAALPFTISEGP